MDVAPPQVCASAVRRDGRQQHSAIERVIFDVGSWLNGKPPLEAVKHDGKPTTSAETAHSLIEDIVCLQVDPPLPLTHWTVVRQPLIHPDHQCMLWHTCADARPPRLQY